MYAKQVQLIVSLLIFTEAVVAIISGYLAVFVSLYLWPDQEHSDLSVSMCILFIMFANSFMIGFFDMYSSRRFYSKTKIIFRILAANGVSFSLLSFLLSSPTQSLHLPIYFLYLFAGINTLALIAERLVLEFAVGSIQDVSFHSRRILLVGSGPRAEIVAKALRRQKSWGHSVVGYLKDGPADAMTGESLPCLGELTGLQEALTSREVDEVIFALEPDSAHRSLQKDLIVCDELGVTYRILPALYDPQDSRTIRVEAIQGVPTLAKSSVPIEPIGMLLKRALDIAVGMIGLTIFCVLYVGVGPMIRLESRGPILFKQVRVGQNGRRFHIMKFRTMVQDAEAIKAKLAAQNEMKGLMFKMKDDPRVTRIGRFLRKTSLDEFPQFINVVRGEMSLVGTRPPTLDEVGQYELRHRRRLSMKPGVTGLWQVSGRNQITDFDEVVRLDLRYIDNWSFLGDVAIIAKTIWVVLARRGAS